MILMRATQEQKEKLTKIAQQWSGLDTIGSIRYAKPAVIVGLVEFLANQHALTIMEDRVGEETLDMTSFEVDDVFIKGPQFEVMP